MLPRGLQQGEFSARRVRCSRTDKDIVQSADEDLGTESGNFKMAFP